MAVVASCSGQEVLRNSKRPTKRALDGWDCRAPMRSGWAMFAGSSLAQSAAFSGFIYTRTESCSRNFIYTRPPASNANRWLAGKVFLDKST